MELPASFSQGGVEWRRHKPESAVRPQAWWRLFGDGELNGLVERALAANQELAGSAARLRQARELSRVARSRFFPDLTRGGSSYSTSSGFSLPLDLRYEVDVWGGIAREVESAQAREAAAAERDAALRLTVAGEVAQTYWTLRAVDANREVVGRALKIRLKALELLRNKKEAGELSGLDLARAETEVASADADRLQLEEQRVRLVDALAVLTGRPATGMRVSEKNFLPAPPKTPVGLPSEVLRRRPDVRAAERVVASANADIGVATAAFYPSFGIGASSGYDSKRLGSLFNASSLVWSLGANAVAPVVQLEGLKGRRQAAVEAHAAASADYRQTVLEALREVEDALQAGAILERRLRSQDLAAAAAEKTFDLAARRFEAGMVSFLEVVDAERTHLEARRQANLIRAERLAVAVVLAKAVGGSW